MPSESDVLSDNVLDQSLAQVDPEIAAVLEQDEHAADVGATWPPAKFGGRDQRLQKAKLVVRQCPAGAEVSN